MEEVKSLVERARSGDLRAYSALVQRFQDMAVGYAYSHLGDFHLAEDAAQEAFIQAYLDLSALREPAAFPGWFRRIVFKHCDRIARKRRAPVVALETAAEVESGAKDPAELLEEQVVKDRVSVAIQALPEHQRMVVSLFYIGEFSYREIAAFLGTPVETVKNRLYAARKRLKREVIDMAKEKLQRQRPSRDACFTAHIMDELAQVSDRAIHRLLCEIDHKDVAVALKGANKDVREKILSNMSERVRNFIEEEIEELAEVEGHEIERAQKVFMDKLREFRYPPHELSKEYLALKGRLRERLQAKSVSRFDCEEITQLFLELTSVACEEGILALEEFHGLAQQDKEDKLFALGLGRVIGVGADLNADILERRMRLLLREQETRYRMIVDGITQLQRGLDGFWMKHKLRSYYTLEDEW